VGGLNTAFSYALYASLIWLGLGYFWAATFSTVIGILFNFKTTGTLVFKNRDNRLVVKFFAVYLVTYTINLCGLWVLHSWHVNSYYSGLIMVVPVAILAYLLMRSFVFRG
jgi:putative flippase GtrA